MVAVLVDDVGRAFGPVTALNGVTWQAQAGQITAVLGPNGAGKTTTMECLEGLQRPDHGQVRVLGADPWRADADHRARVGVMLQDGGLPTMTTAIPLLTHLSSLYAAPAELDSLVTRLGIDQFARTRVRQLSGGQRQRVALAAALIGRPQVAFLDEPTAGLDPHARLDTWDLITQTAAEGTCVVVTTHSFEEAERLADRIVIMAGGRVLADGSVAEVAGDSLEERYFALTGRGR